MTHRRPLLQRLIKALCRPGVWLLRLFMRCVFAFARLAGALPPASRHDASNRLRQTKPSPLVRLSALEMAKRIKSGEVTSEEIVKAHIAQIEAVNPTLNAVVQVRFGQALEEAREADEKVRKAIASGTTADLPQLLGVPCTIKETFEVNGFPCTSGLISRRKAVSVRDAPTVARLRAAGAIVLGLTNVSELTLWWESHNKVYGRTNNAYNTTCIVGGSSGGEGAIISALGSPFGLGADIGGSIRMPAFFNGVFGHKPSPGLVPNVGMFPTSENNPIRLLATGPICRHAEDLFPLVTILSGPDQEDQQCIPYSLSTPESIDLSQLVVVSLPSLPVLLTSDVSQEMADAHARCIEFLRTRGCRIVAPGDVSEIVSSTEIWSAAMSVSTGKSMLELLRHGNAKTLGQMLREFVSGRSPHTLMALVLALVEDLPKLMPGATAKVLADRQILKQKLIDLMTPMGVIVVPSHPVAAYQHMEPILHPFNYIYTGLFNAVELPVTQVPMGLGHHTRMPVGVQVVGKPGDDHVTIRVALEMARAGVATHVDIFAK